MAFTHHFTRGWTGVSGDPAINKVLTITGDTVFEEDLTVPINADHSVVLGIKKTGLQGMALLSDQPLTVTFKDGAGSPATVGTVTLVAGNPYLWTVDDDPTVAPNPLSADCVTMHTDSAANATLNVRVIWNS